MKIQIGLKGIIQYICLYLFFICHDAAIYRENTMLLRIAIVAFSSIVFIGISVKKYSDRNFLLFVCLLTEYLLLRGERNLWLGYIECILITYVTYNVDKKYFCTRFLKVCMFYCLFSLFFYFLGVIAPEQLFKIYDQENNVLWATSWGAPYYMRGRWLYVVRMYELERNNSIFTEPGIWQMFLNLALFILLNMRDALYGFKNTKVIFYVSLVSLAILTTGSTTGYIAMAMIYFFFIITKKKKQLIEAKYLNIIRKIIWGFVIIGVIFLFFDLIWRTTNSLIYSKVIKKILEISSGGTSGHARFSMMEICLGLALINPMGVGEDFLSKYILTMDEGANGAILIHSFASIGIIPVFLILWYYYKDIGKKYVPKTNILLIILLYINTTLAQTRLLYPTLIVMPVIYGEYCREKMLENLQKGNYK